MDYAWNFMLLCHMRIYILSIYTHKYIDNTPFDIGFKVLKRAKDIPRLVPPNKVNQLTKQLVDGCFFRSLVACIFIIDLGVGFGPLFKTGW